VYIHRESEKQDIILLSITSLSIERFSQLVHYDTQQKFGIKRLLKISLHLKSVATLPYEILISEDYVCRVWQGTVFLKYELARDLRYARQQLLWQKQVTVIGLMVVDSFIDKGQSDVAQFWHAVAPIDWTSFLCKGVLLQCFYSLLQQMLTVGHSVNFSVKLIWIAYVTERNEDNIIQQLFWADKSRMAVCFGQFFSRRLFGHFKPRSPWRKLSFLRPKIALAYVTGWTIKLFLSRHSCLATRLINRGHIP